MLWRVLQSNGGTLPADCVVAFANTGKEEEETLEFVRDCGQHWDAPIVWLEYRNDEMGYVVVDYDTASRNGEPFAAIIAKRKYLPNPVTRFCTTELKIRVIHKYLKARNFGGGDEYDMATGIRADEMRRATKIRARGSSAESVKTRMTLPLVDAGVSLRDVSAFWAAQPFNLNLTTINGRTLSGNCDLCFLKGSQQVYSLIRERPTRAVWWAAQEALALALASNPSGAVFRGDRASYAAMLANVQEQTDMFADAIDEAIPCFCGE